jgi:hypothetical protein
MLDFPSPPTLNQVFTAPNGSTWAWDGAKWASTSAGTAYLPLSGGTLTGPLIQAADPVQPLGSATKQYVDATNIRYRNRIINGDMSVDARSGGNQVASPAGNDVYIIDRWRCATSAAVGTIGQIASFGAPSFQYVFGWKTTTAHAVAAAETFIFHTFIEGINFNDAQWGAANAQPVTVEFWASSSLTGTFGGALRNAASNRSYAFTYAIAAANTWQKFRINILGDQVGTWSVASNAAALDLAFSVGAGATYSAATGSWQAGNFVSATGAVSVVATLNATLNITGVALMVGAAAANAEPEFRKYSDNLIDCQRYYQTGAYTISAYGGGGNGTFTPLLFPVKMRASPTLVVAFSQQSNCGSSGQTGITPGGYSPYTVVTSNGNYILTGSFTADADF